MIQKPRREDARIKYGTNLEVMATMLGLMLIPLMSRIPKQSRLTILNLIKKFAEAFT